MNDRKQQTVSDAVHVWELGLLLFLFEKGIISEDEYLGIRQIAEEQHSQKVIMS